MMKEAMEAAVRKQWRRLRESLDERGRREFAATEAEKIGRGGISIVARSTGLARSTIYKAKSDLAVAPTEANRAAVKRRIRRPGGGRKKLSEKDPTVVSDLKQLVESNTRGDPESPLLWTTKSLRKLEVELKGLGHKLSHVKVGELLAEMGFSLQALFKTKEGANHPDRDAQFRYINEQTTAQLEAGSPAVSVDAKKKELVGEFKNGGREWKPKGQPTPVGVYDFLSLADGRATPYGIYDIGANQGWVSVGISYDTASFAAATVLKWWSELGAQRYPDAKQLLITADCGGSNSNRTRLWKLELQSVANALGLPVTVCHHPPGTSKWNKIEHRLFAHISMNWRGQPLTSFQVIVNLIGNTATNSGLTVRCALDPNDYPKGRSVSDAELASVNLLRHDFHGEWNYTVYPSGTIRPDRYPATLPEMID